MADSGPAKRKSAFQAACLREASFSEESVLLEFCM